MAQHHSLRDLQVQAIKRMLNLHKAIPEHENGSSADALRIVSDEEPVWKVLVFDNVGRDIVSSVLRVSDLRDNGVTIHLNINSRRSPIEDAPAVYLIEPTPKNLELVLADLKAGLYSGGTYLNFTSSIARPLLESFAAGVAEAGVGASIASLYDCYLNFQVSEPNMYSLGFDGTYALMNSANTSDQELDDAVDRIASGLFSVCVSMKSLPLIRAPKDGPAPLIAAKLDRKLRDHLLSSKENTLFDTSSRPLLAIVDRNIDITPMISHSWLYECLVTDVFETKLNQITVEVPDETGANITKKNYDLKSNDDFWAKNASLPFPNVAEHIDQELADYKTKAVEITRSAGATSLEDLDGTTNASQLKHALEVLPALKERKAQLDMHMTILTSLLKAIKDRQLDQYFSLEEDVLASKITKTQCLDMIESKDKRGSSPEDALRLFIFFFLGTDAELSRNEFTQFERALSSAGCDISCLPYVRQLRQITRMTMMNSAPASEQQQSSISGDIWSSVSSRLTAGLKESGIGANFDLASLGKGLRNFLPKTHDSTLSQIMHSLMAPSEASSAALSKTQDWLYYDPRSANARGTTPKANKGVEVSFGQKRAGSSKALLLVIGGGSMEEYSSLMAFAKRSAAPGGAERFHITYGSDQIYSPSAFLKDLQKLGKETS